jgi:nitrite reductase/ring-hydroxylating ferredoxin subunit
MGGQVAATGPDFGKDGIAASDVPEGGMVVGQAHGEPVLLIRCDGEAHAVGGACAHYGAMRRVRSRSAARGTTHSST